MKTFDSFGNEFIQNGETRSPPPRPVPATHQGRCRRDNICLYQVRKGIPGRRLHTHRIFHSHVHLPFPLPSLSLSFHFRQPILSRRLSFPCRCPKPVPTTHRGLLRMSDKDHLGGKHSCAAFSHFPKSVLLSMLCSISRVLLSALVTYT